MNDSLQPLDLDLDLEALERAVTPSPLERLQWRASDLALWLRRHALDIVVVTVLAAIATVFHMRGMYDTPARFDDEGTYTAYAWAVQVEHRLGHYTYWYAHPPLGWIQMALWNFLTHSFQHAPYAIAAVRRFTVVCKIVSVVLLYFLALRLRFTRVGASAAVLIFALSPLAIYFTRTALLDNVVTPWLIASFYFAASPKRGLGSAAGSAACFAIAILSKETVLLFLPALVMLLWQCSDHRNRKFTTVLFGSTLTVLLALYPAYALVKNEFFEGSGHVSLLWAIQWQLFDRMGSGSIFNPNSTAHAVVHSWVIQDPWLSWLALAMVLPGLMAKRTRAVALAFSIQLFELLRSGYLPYPFVVAMIPFAALTVAGVVDGLWQRCAVRVVDGPRFVRWLADDRPAARSALSLSPGRIGTAVLRGTRRPRVFLARALPRPLSITGRVTVRLVLVTAAVATLAAMHTSWVTRIDDLWYADHDRGSATALHWLEDNVQKSQVTVVDDAYWVDLVRHGFPQHHVVWFTKLDVDPDVRLGHPAWKGIDYVALTYQDEMSLHLTLDDRATDSTKNSFPTMYQALTHAQIVGRFGTASDRVVIWRVRPNLPATAPAPSG